jgi:hypothetical protein
VDVTPVEVEFTSSSVVVGPTVSIVVPSVDISEDEDKEEYSFELIRFSFVVDIELEKDSVDSEYVVGAVAFDDDMAFVSRLELCTVDS